MRRANEKGERKKRKGTPRLHRGREKSGMGGHEGRTPSPAIKK